MSKKYAIVKTKVFYTRFIEEAKFIKNTHLTFAKSYTTHKLIIGSVATKKEGKDFLTKIVDSIMVRKGINACVGDMTATIRYMNKSVYYTLVEL